MAHPSTFLCVSLVFPPLPLSVPLCPDLRPLCCVHPLIASLCLSVSLFGRLARRCIPLSFSVCLRRSLSMSARLCLCLWLS
eukprot:7282095-Lingulodinium_polyedra.AAC.1